MTATVTFLEVGICVAHLALGVLVGWFMGGARAAAAKASDPANVAESIADLLRKMSTMTERRGASWSELRWLLSNSDAFSEHELANHADINRLFSEMISVYSESLGRLDSDGRFVEEHVLEHIVATEAEAASFADDLRQVDPETCDVHDMFLGRLDALEESNKALRDELEATRQQVVRANERLEAAEAAAHHDVLTGLPNRRAFEARMQELEADHARTGITVSLMMIDLDRFKEINDRHGHAAGDACLQVAGHVIAQSCRHTAHVSRFGGEEFAVLLPDTDASTAGEQAERVRSLVERATARHNGLTIDITCSIGVAELPPGGTRDELISAADRALYSAKNAGRNAVRIDGPPTADISEASEELVGQPG